MGFQALGAVFSALTAVSSISKGNSASKANEKALQQSQANAAATLKASTEANNKANQKRPNTNAIIDATMQAGKAGASGTMLTGPQGVNPDSLALGRTTLLGSSSLYPNSNMNP